MIVDRSRIDKAFAHSTRPVTFSLQEAWLIDNLIRHPWVEENRPVGKALLLKVFSAILELQPKPLSATVIIELTEDELWTIEYHVRRAQKDERGFTIGEPLLLKVFPALLSFDIPDFPSAEGESPANWRSKLAGWRPDSDPDIEQGDKP